MVTAAMVAAEARSMEAAAKKAAAVVVAGAVVAGVEAVKRVVEGRGEGGLRSSARSGIASVKGGPWVEASIAMRVQVGMAAAAQETPRTSATTIQNPV